MMDIIFQKGSYQNFNSSTFDEGNVCFVNQLINNKKNYDYIYRIGANDTKIPLLGYGYSFENNDSEFKVLKDTFNCNDKVKLGEIINFENTDSEGNSYSWDIPSIKGYGSTRNGEIVGNWFILDIEANAGGIVPNPNKKISLGAEYAKWDKLWLTTGIECPSGDFYIRTLGSKTYYDEDKEENITENGDIKLTSITEKVYLNNNTLITSIEYESFKNVPTIQGVGSWQEIIAEDGTNSFIVNSEFLILDVGPEEDDNLAEDFKPAILPNPNKSKKPSLGNSVSRWRGLYLTDKIQCDGSLSIESISIIGQDENLNPSVIDAGDIILKPGTLGCIKTPNISIDKSSSLNNNVKIPSIIGGKRLEGISAYGSVLCLDVSSNTETNDQGETLPGLIGPTPARTGQTDLGGSAMRWGNIYYSGGATGQTLNVSQAYVDGEGTTSDKRLKTIQSDDILQKDLLLYDSLTPVCYKYKNILSDHNYSRTHIGFLAQDVADQIENFDLSSEDCALVQAKPLNEDDPEELKELLSDGYKYYLNYNELHGLHTLKNHQQDDRLTALEEKNAQLENTISELRTQIELLKLAIGG